ncbi:BREX system P-loop protein BrxC [Carboxydothermus hydrogenoformans]|uniref:BREX system P-loop protein BrxC n=1 Tax=Carboxydothermus hydrogenoformans (strain ATCC BAA-161 / DSM 6008 / Z-2901) TaxID=246194 RepID=Q3A8T8_CARHZ|nr:BREX system P-loop protein BrxC [Carboxydothermus hydrogenoformans]ABB14288.1 conserved hypothetical protein [Carboxydothermus hydrogenoformans Z-2901]
MRIRDMFYKKIDRDIKGVIKIGQEDEENAYQELEEYVVTRELKKYFSEFFEAYKKGIIGYTDKMGVWISGFFGSGKSHFLKILSYLLENRVVKGKKAVEYFRDKIDDPMVLADIEMAGNISADVILFNIESKADADSKTQKDAIVKVFNRVFNDMQGFCGSIPWLADLERQMSKDGTYEDFKKEFERISGRKWEEAREDFYYEEDAIVKALASATKMSEQAARNWYNKAEENYTLTVDKFAKRVREYIESKGGNHHVVFCVDEIGQYIGDNSGLMLNLQTLVEDLGTECGGKAWVIVTSQEDIDSITRVKGNDFSKIQGRFNTRISLSSANVDEVIKKRLLKKTQVATDTLKLLYENKSSILKNLITFSADTPEKKFYTDSNDFAEVYPFIPYQFNLLQQVFTSIRIHGASGKHLSEGERSMISSFQEAAIRYADCEEGTLIPFSAFYDTIETFLDSNIRTVIIHAQENSNLNDFDVELLKVLFMIKYLTKEIPPNIENLATLMVSHIDEDKIALKKKIEESLKRLIKENLVQKDGDWYIFLTHEEQDINREIKNIQIDTAEIIQKVSEIIFEDIYPDKKFKYSTRYHFPFNQIVDDRFFRGNQGSEIGVKIITPYYDSGSEMTQLEFKEMSQRENNLIVKLPPDTTFLEEMEEVLKIEAYLRKNGGIASTPTMEEIKNRKRNEASKRKERVKSLIIDALKAAELYVNAQKLDIREKDPVERINEGLRVLIDSLYTKLGYIKAFIDSPSDINNILTQEAVQMSLAEDPNKLALEEVSSYIERNTARNIPVTMRTVINVFQKAPYGWNEEDIEGLIAKLFKAQEVKLQLNGEYLDINDRDLVKYLTKRDYAEKLLIEKRIKISPVLINTAKEIVKEVFGRTALPNDEDGLMRKIKEYMQDECNHIDQLLQNYKYAKYPGKDVLEEGKKLFTALLKIRDAKEFFEEIQNKKEELLDYGDYAHDVKKFFDPEGKQKEIFDKGMRMVELYEKNKTYVLDKAAIELYEQIARIINSKEPYSEIYRLPDLIDKFTKRFAELLEEEAKPIKQVVESDKKKVLDELSSYDFKDKYYEKFRKGFDDLLYRLDHANNFYEVIAMKEESDRLKQRYFEEIANEVEKQKYSHGGASIVAETPEGVIKPPKQKKIVNISLSHLLHGIRNIESKEDIEKLLDEIRAKLESELDENTIIKIV